MAKPITLVHFLFLYIYFVFVAAIEKAGLWLQWCVIFVGLAGNGATFYLLVFAILAGVVGVTSKLSGAYHIRLWRNDTLSAAASSAVVAWAITALAFGCVNMCRI